MNRHLHAPLLCLLTLLGLAAQAGALTPAGTVITNQVRAEYQPPLPGDPGVVLSNMVQTVVQSVCAVSVTPDGTVAQPSRTLSRLPGETALFSYTLVNAGNDTATFPVSGRVEAGISSAPALRVVHDQNGNGLSDAGEPELSEVTLAPDASVNLLLVTGMLAQGTALVNLVSGCAGAAADDNNVSRIVVGPPPALTLTKTFEPVLLRPGSDTTVTVVTTNSGEGESREVTVSDALGEQIAQGLTYVPGSAQSSAGTLEFTTDGTIWSAQESAPVRGVRVRLGSLKPAESVRLSFRMRAAEAANGRVIPNTATALSGTQALSSTARVEVRYLPAVAIGPLGQPEAEEGSEADRQSRNFGVVGQAVCFEHTAKNTGDVADLYRVDVSYPQGAAKVTLLGADSRPLAQPLALEPGQRATVRACYEPQQASPLSALLTIKGERGTSNTTGDQLQSVETGLPELRKSYRATTVGDDGKTLEVPQDRPVRAGDTVTYTLSVRNPYTRPLTAVVVSDPLPAHLDFVSASDGGQKTGVAGAETVRWTLDSLARGETRSLSITTRVSSRAVDGELLKNTFGMVTAEFPDALKSNEVATPVWQARLSITKSVSSREATFGDRLVYTLTITNHSQTTAIVDIVIVDTASRGLEYVPGTSTLNGEALEDPDIVTGQNTWTSTWTLKQIPAGATSTVTYVSRVTPEASGELLNVVQAAGSGSIGSLARAIASNQARAVTRLNLLQFAPQADILGVVFVDRNRNGLYDEALDTPVARARVLLAGGREALTDGRGRYSFGNVRIGTHALRLDPSTTPYQALVPPQAGGLSGTRTVQVIGLTSVDFPLAPLGGDISVLRRTTLNIGDVRVEKTVFSRPGGYTVQLRILTPRTLQDVTLIDPLPTGAALKEGRNILNGTLNPGETFLTYQFDWTGEPRAATTDPVMTWRY